MSSRVITAGIAIVLVLVVIVLFVLCGHKALDLTFSEAKARLITSSEVEESKKWHFDNYDHATEDTLSIGVYNDFMNPEHTFTSEDCYRKKSVKSFIETKSEYYVVRSLYFPNGEDDSRYEGGGLIQAHFQEQILKFDNEKDAADVVNQVRSSIKDKECTYTPDSYIFLSDQNSSLRAPGKSIGYRYTSTVNESYMVLVIEDGKNLITLLSYDPHTTDQFGQPIDWDPIFNTAISKLFGQLVITAKKICQYPEDCFLKRL